MAVNNTIPILEKTISVLDAIAASETGVSAKWLSISLKIPPATCYRILRTLGKSNWICANGDGQYKIAFGLASLTNSYSEIEHLLRRLTIPLRSLSDATGLSVKISLREAHCAVTAFRVESSRPNAIASKVGSKMHLTEAGAAGAVLLSALPQAEVDAVLATAPREYWAMRSLDAFRKEVLDARRFGISRALGKFNPSIYAMAVPLKFSPDNLAALVVVGWPEDFEGPKKTRLERELKKHGQSIQRLIHHSETSG